MSSNTPETDGQPTDARATDGGAADADAPPTERSGAPATFSPTDRRRLGNLVDAENEWWF